MTNIYNQSPMHTFSIQAHLTSQVVSEAVQQRFYEQRWRDADDITRRHLSQRGVLT